MLKKIDKLYRVMLCLLFAALFFSYYPLIKLGSGETMDFELSLPLILLVMFDVVGFVILLKKRKLFFNFKNKWVWLLLPVYLTVSVIWSANNLRGVFVAVVLWSIYSAGFIIYNLREELSDNFRHVFWKVFFGATFIVCLWCFLQCILDLVGVPKEYSLMCEGCTYRSFGFPHPNGFAIEPQFMGNLFLAPIVVTVWLLLKQKCKKTEQKDYHPLDAVFLWFFLFVVIVTLFLTFSRGAIYALVVAMVFMTSFTIGRARKEWKKATKSMVKIWFVIVLAFLFTLNLQGMMAALSPTNDTYFSGTAKALNHLSLGTIDIRKNSTIPEKTREKEGTLQGEVVEKPVENLREVSTKVAYFDGYVVESTNVRMEMNYVALKLWTKDFQTTVFGVGLGGAGQALYNNGLTEWPKEIVQNQYVSLLLETGLIGVIILILTLVSVVVLVIRMKQSVVILTLTVAYGVSLTFFAGLPNALQVYLMPMLLMVLL